MWWAQGEVEVCSVGDERTVELLGITRMPERCLDVLSIPGIWHPRVDSLYCG